MLITSSTFDYDNFNQPTSRKCDRNTMLINSLVGKASHGHFTPQNDL